jgi:nucleotide-binding universal stress UspA family protein
MYKTIMVPLDGSPFGERALPLACELATRMNGRIVLVRATTAAAFPGIDPTDAQVRAVADAESYLSGVAQRVSQQRVDVDYSVACEPAEKCILLEAELHRADLIVMCSHGRSGLGRWIYGSVANAVLAKSLVPVILVRPTGEPATIPPESTAPGLLVPLDGSRHAEAALPHAAALARALGGCISLVRAVMPPAVTYSDYAFVQPSGGDLVNDIVEERQKDAEHYLAEVAARPPLSELQVEGCQVHMFVRRGWPADVIADAEGQPGNQMVVMATHGRTGLSRLLMGSVAFDVVRRGVLPVLLVRPAELTREELGNRPD